MSENRAQRALSRTVPTMQRKRILLILHVYLDLLLKKGGMMKKISKLLGLIIFLLLLVISGCRNQDDLSLDNVGLESNNSRGEPWPNVLIWYKTDKRMIDANDNFSLRFSFAVVRIMQDGKMEAADRNHGRRTDC